MWPLWLIITVAVAGAAILTITGVLLAITLERRRHSRILKAHGLTRGLSRYHRPKLSANELNYSHITPPTTNLRRSVQLPYGVVSVGHTQQPDADEEKQADTPTAQPHAFIDVLRPKNNKGAQRSFTGSPLYIPKTRRPGRLRKAVPIELLPRSPLSAITEFSDPPTSAPPDASEFPGSSTTMLVPEQAIIAAPKHGSTQWPLLIANARGSGAIPTEVMEIAARESVLVRKGGGVQSQAPTTNPVAVTRSVGPLSMASLAPNDPLPSLPTINRHRPLDHYDLRARTSNASLETVGSSVLGTYLSSPMNNDTKHSTSRAAMNRRSPAFNLELKREFATPDLQAPPVKKTIHGLVSAKSIRSLHPNVECDETSPNRARSIRPQLPCPIVAEDSFKTIDASTWALPSLQISKLRGRSIEPDRHSMIESSKLAQLRAVSDPATACAAQDDISAIGLALKRPNSVAAGTLLHWEQQEPTLTKRHSLTSLDGQKRGHRRQNCMRITNLPIVEARLSVQRLPGLSEEQQQSSPEETIQNSFEVKQPRPVFKTRPPQLNFRASQTPSPFKNAPILTPTARPIRKQYIQPRTNAASATRRPASTLRPDSEVFDSNQTDMLMSSPYKTTPQHWPLSPSFPNEVPNNPSSTCQTDRTRFESPILPSPALNAASLYPRKSLVKGPRSPRNSGQSNNTTSTSPLQNKQGHNYRVTKIRDASGQHEAALGKSGRLLRTLKSEAPLQDQQQSQLFDTATPERSPEILALPSPLLNKRILGLRTSSCTPSIISIAPSPTLEKQQSRGPSPLANTSVLHTSKPNRVESALYSKPTLDLPTSHLSLTSSMRVPSMMSTSNASIWEDVSVRADSPSPEPGEASLFVASHVAPLPLRTLSNVRADQKSRYSNAYPSRSSSHTRRASQQYAAPSITTKDFGAAPIHEYEGDENVDDNLNASHVVQQLERVVSNGQWERKNLAPIRTITIETTNTANGRKQSHDKHEPVTPRTKREMDVFGGGASGGARNVRDENANRKGVGLGLRLDNLIVGSSYLNR